MNDNDAPLPENPSRREPWNKGRLPDAKPPETEPCVINRNRLQLDRRTRDLAFGSPGRCCSAMYRATRCRLRGQPLRFAHDFFVLES